MLARKGNWFQVKLRDKREGWAYKSLFGKQPIHINENSDGTTKRRSLSEAPATAKDKENAKPDKNRELPPVE